MYIFTYMFKEFNFLNNDMIIKFVCVCVCVFVLWVSHMTLLYSQLSQVSLLCVFGDHIV